VIHKLQTDLFADFVLTGVGLPCHFGYDSLNNGQVWAKASLIGQCMAVRAFTLSTIMAIGQLASPMGMHPEIICRFGQRLL
jgi:hypothetical protein